MKKYSVLLALAVSLLLVQAAAAELVVNGGFETGDFTGWTPTDLIGSPTGPPAPDAYVLSGNYAAEVYAFESIGYLSQTLTTAIDQSYTLRFWLQNGLWDPIAPNQFLVKWNGTEIYNQSDLAEFSFKELVFTSLVATAATTLLEFGFRHDPDYWRLDDVSVNPVPIPGTVVLLGSGLLSLLGWRRLRKS